MQVTSIAECSKGSILQFFRPSLSYHFHIKIFDFVYFWMAVLHKLYCMIICACYDLKAHIYFSTSAVIAVIV